MSVLIETSLGDLVIDLFTEDCPNTTKNFLKLCKIKYYHNCLFHNILKDYIVQTGDPTNTGKGGESIYGILFGEQAKYFEDEIRLNLKHDKIGTVSMASKGPNQNASQFFITTSNELPQLDGKHTIFGRVVEGLDVLEKINSAFADSDGKARQVIRIKHTHILDDPFPDPPGIQIPDASPEWNPEKIKDLGSLLLEEEIENLDKLDQKTVEEIEEEAKEKETKSRAEVLEILGDIPFVDAAPPENVLFVCRLNPVTTSEDLEIIFSRFGEIKNCEVVRDWKTGDSLQYAFIEFADVKSCEAAYFKMENVLIDDRRIHVDFCQSVSKLIKGKDGRTRRVLQQDWVNRRKPGKVVEKESNLLITEKYRNKSDPKYGMVFDEETKKRKKRKKQREEKGRKEKGGKEPK